MSFKTFSLQRTETAMQQYSKYPFPCIQHLAKYYLQSFGLSHFLTHNGSAAHPSKFLVSPFQPAAIFDFQFNPWKLGKYCISTQPLFLYPLFQTFVCNFVVIWCVHKDLVVILRFSYLILQLPNVLTK